MKSLLELGRAHGTDKAWCPNEENCYLKRYEGLFEPIRNKTITLLELGVREGQSLRMWKEYFPFGQIVGVDIDPKCKQYEEYRIGIVICSQDLFRPLGKLDIIIDDASHINILTIATFKNLWPFVESGGMYIIEDLLSSYDTHLGESIVSGGWPGMHFNDQSICKANDRIQMNDFFSSIICAIDCGAENVASIQFFPHLAVVTKK